MCARCCRVPLLCACGSLGAGAAAAVCDCCVRVGDWVLAPLLCAAAVCVWELGCWCRCCVLLLCATVVCVWGPGVGAAAVCGCCVRVELGCWRRRCVRVGAWVLVPPLRARGSLGAGAAAACRCCARVGAWALAPLLCAAAVLLLCARGSLGAGAAAVCRCCVRVGGAGAAAVRRCSVRVGA